jgi:hypothetical protein
VVAASATTAANSVVAAVHCASVLGAQGLVAELVECFGQLPSLQHLDSAPQTLAVAVAASVAEAAGFEQVAPLQQSHSPQQVVVAAVEATFAVVVAVSPVAAALLCSQHDFSPPHADPQDEHVASQDVHPVLHDVHAVLQEEHAAAAGAADSVAVICSIANTLVANVVKIKITSVDFMSFLRVSGRQKSARW